MVTLLNACNTLFIFFNVSTKAFELLNMFANLFNLSVGVFHLLTNSLFLTRDNQSVGFLQFVAGRVKPGFARSGVYPRWVLPGWLTQANTYTVAFSQALLHDPRQFVCPDLFAFQIAFTGIEPCVPGFSRVQVLPGPGGFHFHLCFAGFCMCGSRVVPRQFACAVWRARSC